MNLIENHTEFLIIEIHHYVFIIFSDRFADNGIEKPFIILMKQQVYFVINRQMFDETIVKGFFKRSVLVEHWSPDWLHNILFPEWNRSVPVRANQERP